MSLTCADGWTTSPNACGRRATCPRRARLVPLGVRTCAVPRAGCPRALARRKRIGLPRTWWARTWTGKTGRGSADTSTIRQAGRTRAGGDALEATRVRQSDEPDDAAPDEGEPGEPGTNAASHDGATEHEPRAPGMWYDASCGGEPFAAARRLWGLETSTEAAYAQAPTTRRSPSRGPWCSGRPGTRRAGGLGGGVARIRGLVGWSPPLTLLALLPTLILTRFACLPSPAARPGLERRVVPQAGSGSFRTVPAVTVRRLRCRAGGAAPAAGPAQWWHGWLLLSAPSAARHWTPGPPGRGPRCVLASRICGGRCHPALGLIPTYGRAIAPAASSSWSMPYLGTRRSCPARAHRRICRRDRTQFPIWLIAGVMSLIAAAALVPTPPAAAAPAVSCSRARRSGGCGARNGCGCSLASPWAAISSPQPP